MNHLYQDRQLRDHHQCVRQETAAQTIRWPQRNDATQNVSGQEGDGP